MENCQNFKGENENLNKMEKTYNVYSTIDGGRVAYSTTTDYNHCWTEELSGLKEGDKFYVVTGEYDYEYDFEDILYEKPSDEEIIEYFREMHERLEDMAEGLALDIDYDPDEFTKEEFIKDSFEKKCRITVYELEIDPTAEEYGRLLYGLAWVDDKCYTPSEFSDTNFYAQTEEDTDK